MARHVSEEQTPLGMSVEIEPMEAKSADTLPAGEGWQYEPKWDGFRCIVFKNGGNVDLRAKSGKPLGRYFPEVVDFIAALPVARFVVDGELVVEIEGTLSFDALQARLHPAESRVRKLSGETPARLVAFDMLMDTDGVPILDQPLADRRARLEDFAKIIDADLRQLVVSPFTRDHQKAEAWLSGSGNDTDGVVCKRLDQPYRPGERVMTKVKRLRTADCVVGGFRYGSDSELVGSLLLGLYNDKGKLDHVGYTSAIPVSEKPDLTKRLEALRGEPGFTGKAPGGPSRWSNERSSDWQPLRPELVVEVRFDHVTGQRFRHGTKFLRWRPDKRPTQCDFRQIDH
ncbi:ATP-dependent DNA ligase [Rhizobium sp. Root1203]|uniref:ATP-dependent DNA ligase n=1 Tax=Rhizobium sp. Root1203 TaxID=1736427 RepID=UPI00070A1B8C|nr:ATP-dependent DNA ligase [Rhizobium sp. Root1203]KQV21647.1 ATP-dependent DNA ligase [Rhizobium sp. Root1203]